MAVRYLITLAGAIGGLVNALLSDNGFILPRRKMTTMNTTIWCPGAISNVLIGAFAAASSWAFYGSGASIDLGQTTERAQVSLKMSALAGALIVGVGGARWLTNEVDKRLLKESATVAVQKNISSLECEKMMRASPRQALEAIEDSP